METSFATARRSGARPARPRRHPAASGDVGAALPRRRGLAGRDPVGRGPARAGGRARRGAGARRHRPPGEPGQRRDDAHRRRDRGDARARGGAHRGLAVPRPARDLGLGGVDALAARRVGAAGARARPARPVPRGLRGGRRSSACATCSSPTRACCGRRTSCARRATCPPTCASRSACSPARRTRPRCGCWAGLGADSINVPSDLSVSQIAELRAASTARWTSTSSRPTTSAGSCGSMTPPS